ncbi:hypothetical protein ACVR05_05245 [Streptococcus caprae]|uniref:Lipoprotein n=1 Tax=Streptococcus caprae TaxID=1640501 RepID=A0ABV8CT77_9STRE
MKKTNLALLAVALCQLCLFISNKSPVFGGCALIFLVAAFLGEK